MVKREITIIVISILILIGSVSMIFYFRSSNNSGGYEKRINEILSDDKEIERKWLIKKEDIERLGQW